ncbi:MAG: arylsulfatase [Candidatus Hydrogenedens sp.]|jgi:arylsulfatase A-like enzyme|nr:arylsulfatase [Candidatus Hydrogenedens sp.]
MKQLSRREMLCGLTIGAGLALWPSSSPAEKERAKPNIVFILADDLGYGGLGCYGQEKIKTPHIDRMALEGMRFTQAYAGSTVCAPSRCALMTGLHTGHCRIRGNHSLTRPDALSLLEEDMTVAESLRSAGYHTALIGKWGLGEPHTPGGPLKKGFQEFYGYTDQGEAHNYYPEWLWRNDEKESLPGNVLEMPRVAKERVTYSHDLFTKEALTFIDRQKDDPFFLYLAYTLPHANNEASRVREHGMEVPEEGIYADEDWPPAQRGHAAMISRLDRDVGALLDRLKEKGIAENTLVIFASDNGPHREGGADPDFFQDSGPFRGIKRDLYEGGIRVPAIAWWPGVIAPGQVSDHPWAFWDFPATAVELARAEAPEDDGISIVPTLKGEGEQAVHDTFYWEFHEGGCKQAVRFGDWKAIQPGRKKKMELYDLSQDPQEQNNCIDRHPEKAMAAKRFLRQERRESEDFPLR